MKVKKFVKKNEIKTTTTSHGQLNADAHYTDWNL